MSERERDSKQQQRETRESREREKKIRDYFRFCPIFSFVIYHHTLREAFFVHRVFPLSFEAALVYNSIHYTHTKRARKEAFHFLSPDLLLQQHRALVDSAFLVVPPPRAQPHSHSPSSAVATNLLLPRRFGHLHKPRGTVHPLYGRRRRRARRRARSFFAAAAEPGRAREPAAPAAAVALQGSSPSSPLPAAARPLLHLRKQPREPRRGGHGRRRLQQCRPDAPPSGLWERADPPEGRAGAEDAL